MAWGILGRRHRWWTKSFEFSGLNEASGGLVSGPHQKVLSVDRHEAEGEVHTPRAWAREVSGSGEVVFNHIGAVDDSRQ